MTKSKEAVIHSLRIYVLLLSFSILFSQPAIPQTQGTSEPTRSTATPKPHSKENQANCANNGTYVNSEGQTVRRPENCASPPKGATAQCRDGTYSFSQNKRGTCSHHGGVARWL